VRYKIIVVDKDDVKLRSYEVDADDDGAAILEAFDLEEQRGEPLPETRAQVFFEVERISDRTN
jgi:hypothetical protein